VVPRESFFVTRHNLMIGLLFPDSPQVSLRLGKTLDADNIRTDHDVYFECDVKANPSPLRLEWLHNVNNTWSIMEFQ
jgi:hypothetical protein